MSTRKGEAARERIIAAAWDAVDDTGVEQLLAGVSLRQVAERAGVSPSSVTYHFESMPALADAMAQWLLAQLQDFPVDAVEQLLLAERGSLADAIRSACELNWNRLTSEEQQRYMRRLMRLFAGTGSTVDGARLSELLRSRYWGRFVPDVEELYDRILSQLGLRWREPFDAGVLARAGAGWWIQQWMVDRSLRARTYADVLVALVSAATVPADHAGEIAELELALPEIFREVGADHRDAVDFPERHQLAARAAPLFDDDFDDVTLTDVARAMGLPVREVSTRFGSVRRVAALAFARHLPAVDEAGARRTHLDPMVGLADLLCELARRAQSDRQCARALLAERIGAQLDAPQAVEVDDIRISVPLGPLLFEVARPVTDLGPEQLYDVAALMVDTALDYAMTRPDAAPAAVADLVLRLLPRTEHLRGNASDAV
jgi:AcrR family transcriptional regulator